MMRERRHNSIAWLLLLMAVTLGVSRLIVPVGSTAQTSEVVTSVSAASFEAAPVAPDSLVAAFGARLATQTLVASALPLPTELGGTTVEVNGRRAGLFFVASTQINYLLPAETESGTANVVVRAGDGTVSSGMVQVTQVAPALFTDNNGRGAPAGYLVRAKSAGASLAESATEKLSSRAIALGADERVFLVLFLSGIRHAADPNGDGNLQETVKVVLGGREFTPGFAGPQPDLAGLDQINFEMPRSFAGRGRVSLAVTAVGRASNLAEIEIAAAGSAPPLLSGFTPTSIYAGQVLTINGSGFAPNLKDNTVRMGGLKARVLSAYDTQLTALVPFGAATGVVAVQTPEGEVASTTTLAVRTSLSGFIETTHRQPLSGATVRVVNRNLAAVTDGEGFFLLPDLPAGSVLIEVDGSTVPAAVAFPKIALRVNVTANRDNQFTRPLALQAVTGARLPLGLTNAARVSTSIPTPSGNLTFESPGNATARFPDGSPALNPALTLVEESRLLVALPAGQFSRVIAQFTPLGASFAPGGKLSFPNSEGWSAGTQAKLFRLDQRLGSIFDPGSTSPTLGSFIEAGTAIVSADGQRVETAADAIKETSCYFVALPQALTTVIGRVVESDGTPVSNAFVLARGQEAVTGGDGGFILRNVPVKAGEMISVEVSLLRPQGRVERALRRDVQAVAAATTEVTPDIVLPTETSNRPPVILAPASLVANQSETREVNFIVSDPDSNQTLQVTVAGAPFVSLKPGIGANPYRLVIAPGPADLGQHTLTLTARDEMGASATHQIKLALNRLPIAQGAALVTDEDTRRPLTLAANDPDGAPLTFTVVARPAHGSLSGTAPSLIYTPAPNYNGADSFTFRAADEFGEGNTARISLAIKPVNDPPVLSVALEQSAATGEQLSFTLTAVDPDVVAGEVQTLTFAATELPGGAQFAQLNETSAQFTWIPQATQVGTYRVNFKVSDDGAPQLSDSKSVTIRVLGRWTPTAPLEGGWIMALFSQGATLLAGTQGGGAFISSDQGQTWTAVKAGFANTDVTAFAALGTTILASSYGAVYRSTDQGQSWNRVSSVLPYIRALVVDGAKVWAATDGGIYLSTDTGQSWTPFNRGLTTLRMRALVLQGGRLVAGSESNGFFLSTDQGQNWTAVNVGVPNLSVRAFATSGARLFAATSSGIFSSNDQGQSWTQANGGLTNRDVFALAVSGTTLFAGANLGGGIFRSTDQGQSWVAVNEGYGGAQVSTLVVSGANLFAGTYNGGVFRSPDQGQTWAAVNAGLTAVRVFSCAASGSNLFAGTGNGVIRSSDQGRSWVTVNTNLPPYRDFYALTVSGATLFAGSSFGGRGVHRSTDQGLNWLTLSQGLTNTDVRSLAVSEGALLAGTNGGGVFRSGDQGQSWTPIPVGLTTRPIRALAVIGRNLFAGSEGDGVYRSTDNGQSWTAINTGLSNLTVNTLVVSGSNLLAGTSGGGVFLSTDNGQSWIESNAGLTNRGVNALLVNGASLYAGTNGGVFLSTDSGQSWMPINTGLTNTIVLSLAARGPYLVAGTLGGGVFVSQF